MLNATLRLGATSRTLTVDGQTFDLNALSPADNHKVRHVLVEAARIKTGKP